MIYVNKLNSVFEMEKSMGDRLREAREVAGYKSASKAADALGVNASTYRAHENGQNDYSYKEAVHYARKFKTDPFWLLSGRRLVPAPLAGESSDYSASPGDIGELDIRAGMGGGGFLHVESDGNGRVAPEYLSGHWSFPDHIKASIRNIRAVYALPVIGDSMEPTIAGGSIVFVDTSYNLPSPPDIYAVDYGDGLMVKRLELVPHSEMIRVISDNDRYSAYEMNRDQISVHGRIIASFQWRG